MLRQFQLNHRKLKLIDLPIVKKKLKLKKIFFIHLNLELSQLKLWGSLLYNVRSYVLKNVNNVQYEKVKLTR